jgi:predicted esterase
MHGRNPAIRTRRRKTPIRRFSPGGTSTGLAEIALEPRALLSGVGSAEVVSVVHVARMRLTHSQQIDQPDATIDLPGGLSPGARYPVVAVYTPDGNIRRTLRTWQPVANRFHWIVYASKDYSNAAAAAAPDFGTFLATAKAHLDAALTALPADRGHVVLSGFSGGAGFALDLNEDYPGFAAAVIDNAGGSQYLNAPPGVSFPASAFANSRRLAVFLSSPTDQRFGPEASQTRDLYAANGWQTLTLSFRGGHIEAPSATYLRAAGWIVAQPAWSRP